MVRLLKPPKEPQDSGKGPKKSLLLSVRFCRKGNVVLLLPHPGGSVPVRLVP